MGDEASPVHIDVRRFEFTSEKRANTMKITNDTDKAVAFKLMAKTPRAYTVVPTKGFVGPGSTQEVQVTVRKEVGSDVLQDCFQLEVRRLAGSELVAFDVQDDAAACSKALGVEVPADQKLAVFLWGMWKKRPEAAETTKIKLESTYSPDEAAGGGGGVAAPAGGGMVGTPAAATEAGTPAMGTAVGDDGGAGSALAGSRRIQKQKGVIQELEAEIQALKATGDAMKLAAQSREASADEVSNKASPPTTLPFAGFAAMWLVFFFFGLTLSRSFPNML